MKMIFNDLSSSFPASSILEGRTLMEGLLRVYIKGTKEGLDDSLIAHKNFDGTLLAPSYPIEKWRNDLEVDREIKRLYKLLNSKIEFLDEIFEDELKTRDFICEKGSSLCCLLSSSINSIMLSFLSDVQWDSNSIEGNINYLDDTGNIVQENIKLFNASRESHIIDNQDYINKCISLEKSNIINGQDLWSRKAELFPNLIFCDNTRKNISNLRKSDKELRQILIKLHMLEEHCKRQSFSTFNNSKNSIKIS